MIVPGMLEHIDHFLIHYHWLMHAAIARKVRLYPLHLKHHNLWHIAHYGRFLNPARIWCYDFEDFMSVIIQIGKSCLAGSSMKIIGNKIVENYTLVLELTLRQNMKSVVPA